MKTFRIAGTQTTTVYFDVKAESEQEALSILNEYEDELAVFVGEGHSEISDYRVIEVSGE